MTGIDIPPFHVHPGHAFDGFELLDRAGTPPLLLARCECGAVLDLAVARFAQCPDCAREGDACARCAGTARIVNHAALQWVQNVPRSQASSGSTLAPIAEPAAPFRPGPVRRVSRPRSMTRSGWDAIPSDLQQPAQTGGGGRTTHASIGAT